MGVGLNSALGLVGTLGVAATKATEAIGSMKGPSGGGDEASIANAQNTGNDSYVPIDNDDKEAFNNFASYANTPISRANDGELSIQMADKAMKNMAKSLQARKAVRARFRGGKR